MKRGKTIAIFLMQTAVPQGYHRVPQGTIPWLGPYLRYKVPPNFVSGIVGILWEKMKNYLALFIGLILGSNYRDIWGIGPCRKIKIIAVPVSTILDCFVRFDEKICAHF